MYAQGLHQPRLSVKNFQSIGSALLILPRGVLDNCRQGKELWTDSWHSGEELQELSEARKKEKQNKENRPEGVVLSS